MSLEQHALSRSDTTGHKRKRPSQEAATVQEEIAWTAARCNRLLRSISSRISTLRRLANTEHQIDADRKRSKPKVLPRAGNRASEADPVWLPGGTRKPARRTYAGRAKSTKLTRQGNQQNENLGPIAFPSPFVRRLANSSVCDDASTREAAASLNDSSETNRRSRQLPIKPNSAIEEAERALVSAWYTLLQQTRCTDRKPPRTGARSLMSTCLRKIPEYIELENDGLEEDDEAGDISSEILLDLEGLGTKENAGWPGLREVARACGLQLIRRAAEDSCLSEAIFDELVRLAGRFKDFDAVDAIAEIGLENSSKTLPRWLSKSIWHCKNAGSSQPFRIASEWLDTEPTQLVKISQAIDLWPRLLDDLARENSSGASKFLVSCGSAIRVLENGGSLATGISAAVKAIMIKITVMAAASLVLSDSGDENRLLQDTVHQIAAGSAFDCLDASPRRPSDLSAFFIMCSQLLLGLNLKHRSRHGVLSNDGLSVVLHRPYKGRASGSVRLRNQQESFASAFAEGITELARKLDPDLLEHFLDRTLEHRGSEPLLQQVATQVISLARHSATATDDELYSDYMRRMTTSTGEDEHDDLAALRTPFQSNKKSGRGNLRWESGICEWVTMTPFPSAKAFQQSQDNTPLLTHSDGEDDHSEDKGSDRPITPDSRPHGGSPKVIVKSSKGGGADSRVQTPVLPITPPRDKSYNSPKVIIKAASPDVLALSTKPKRKSVTLNDSGWKVSKKRKSEDSVQAKRKSSRISAASAREEDEGSADELGF